MQVKNIAEHSAILSTFIKLSFVIKIFVLSILEWPFYTGFTVHEILELVTSVRSHGSDKPAHPHSLSRTFTACERNLWT